MSCRAVAVICTIACATSIASAEPDPTPAPADVSWYGAALPAEAPEVPVRIRHVIRRGGLFALAGGTYVGGAMNGRIDLGVPVPTARAPRLRALLVTEGRYATESDSTKRRTLAVTAAVQYEWHLPFELKTGELLVVAAAGLRRTTLWIERPDEPFWPATWESASVYALRLTAGIEYRGQRGLIVSVQPLSAGLPFTTPEKPDPRWMEPEPSTNYAVSVVAGYQFQ